MTESKAKAPTISLIRAELKAPKSQYNSFGKYKYRNVEDIYEGLKPLMVKYCAQYDIDEDIVDVGGHAMVKATAIYKDSDQEITSHGFAEISQHKGMSPEQCMGTASSYAVKYALNKLFQLDDTQDVDSMDNSQAQLQRTRQPRQTAEQKARHDAATAIFEAKNRVQQEADNTVVDSEGTTLLQLYRDAQQQGKGSAPSQALGKWAKENGKDGLALINAIHNTQAWV